MHNQRRAFYGGAFRGSMHSRGVSLLTINSGDDYKQGWALQSKSFIVVLEGHYHTVPVSGAVSGVVTAMKYLEQYVYGSFQFLTGLERLLHNPLVCVCMLPVMMWSNL